MGLALAIEIGRRQLRAVLADRGRGSIAIARTLVESIPSSVDPDDAEAVGRWVGECLSSAKLPKSKAIIAVARTQVGLKRLTLPTTEASELPEMTRLALQRELPFDAEDAVIDFLPMSVEESSTTVLAVAIPGAMIEHTRKLAKAAGLGVERITLRSLGTAAVIASSAEDSDRCALSVDITTDGLEYNVVSGDAVVFSRAADLPEVDESHLAAAVITETRRTWMSYRIAHASTDVGGVFILGGNGIGDDAQQPIADMLNVPARHLSSHPMIDQNGHAMHDLWPLAGLLLRPSLGLETIDFLHPRKAPDINARRRQLMLACVGALAILSFGLWSVGNRNLKDLRHEVASLKEKRDSMRDAYNETSRLRYQLEHVRRWEDVGVGWLDHLAFLTEFSPDPEKVLFDSWDGRLDFGGVRFSRPRNGEPGAWSIDKSIRITLEGEAADRPTADAFRTALVNDPVYIQRSNGAESVGGKRLPIPFSYTLHTRADKPMTAQKDEQETDQPAPGRDEAIASRTGGGQ